MSLLSSKVVVVEEEPRVRGIPSAPTSVAGAVGITERGPIGEAVLCTSWEEFLQKFGGFTPNSELALGAMGFFANGGSHLWVVRTCHYDDVSDPGSSTAGRAIGALTNTGISSPAIVTGTIPGPFSVDNGAQFAISVNGDPEQVFTLNASAALVETSTPGPYVLTDGDTLEIRIDDGPVQTIEFTTANFFGDWANAKPEFVCDVINKSIVGGRAWWDMNSIDIASDTEGAGSKIEIVGGTANATFAYPTAPVSGTGYAQDISNVSIAEVQALVAGLGLPVELFETPSGAAELRTVAIGPSASIQIGPATTPILGFDNDLHTGTGAGVATVIEVLGKDPGAYANSIELEVGPPTSGEPGHFDLAVIEDGAYRESFSNVNMNEDSEYYVEKVVNDVRTGSVFITVADKHLGGGYVPDEQIVQLISGDDGLTGLDDNDFVGSSIGKTGLHAFDHVQDLSLLFVPGRATAAVHNAMVTYCEVERDGMVFAVLDSPENQRATDIVDYVQSTAGLLNLSEHAAIYWPRVKVLNPAKSVFGSDEKIVVAPSGIICGVYARTDGARSGGIYDPPAGVDKGRMFGVLGFEMDEVLEEAKRDLVYPKRINPLTTGPGYPRYIDGSRTLKGDGNFPYISERRGVTFIERSLKQGLQFARHRNNDEKLRAEVRRTITAFLTTQMNNGAFRSRDPKKAFFVDVSEELNTPSVIFAAKLVARVGLATNKPAEFIILRISQDTRALEAELAGGTS